MDTDYDISGSHPVAVTLKLIRAHATGGQKSLHEIFLTPADQRKQTDFIRVLLESHTARFLLIRPELRSRVEVLGKAVAPALTPDYFYVG